MEVFFYGLFMDATLLHKKGIMPTSSRSGYLQDYTLKIGDRASLIPCKYEIAYGIVMNIDDDAIQQLYADASVADYIPEEVMVITDTKESVKATCYNLPFNALSRTNSSYALSLFRLASKIGFPDEYVDKIKIMARITPDTL